MESSEAQKPPSIGSVKAHGGLAEKLGIIFCFLVFLSFVQNADFAFAGGGKTVGLTLFNPQNAEDLSKVLDIAWKNLESKTSVPNIAPSFFPSDMPALSVKERKALFMKSVLPHVLDVNHGIAKERKHVEAALAKLQKGQKLASMEKERLAEIAKRYRLKKRVDEIMGSDPEPALRELVLRVDEIPVGMAIAQAAVESAWGTSRFALEGNAIFGQWVFSPSKGMKPQGKDESANFSVARFSGLTKSVEAYMRNLNTLWAYEDFRVERARMRTEGKGLDSMRLAAGLLLYSEKRESYVESVRKVLRGNRLGQFDGATLEIVETASAGEAGNANSGLTALKSESSVSPDG